MSESSKPASVPQLSVVIPSYNSAPWLASTLAALTAALVRAGVEGTTEVIVVDDGSTDDTRRVLREVAAHTPGLRVVSQGNRGRFLARWKGIEQAAAPWILLLDSRVLLDDEALAYVLPRAMSDASPRAWNAHVRTAQGVPLVGLFWDVPTHIFWGDYLRDPRPFDLTPETFDRAPKGTGVFLAPRDMLRAAFLEAWPEGDAKLVSDDTKVLRWIAAHGGIRLDPAFGAVYRPRTTTRGFIRHTWDRGTLFVDSYAGTGTLRTTALIALLLAPVLGVALLIGLLAAGRWAAALGFLGAVVLMLLAPIIPAALRRCPARSILAYVWSLPLFIAPFWGGLVRGAVLHRRAFLRRPPVGSQGDLT